MCLLSNTNKGCKILKEYFNNTKRGNRMEDFKSTTTFQLPIELRQKVGEIANREDTTVSKLLNKALDELVNNPIADIPKLEQKNIRKAELKYTSVILSDNLMKQARQIALDRGISLADIFRYCLTTID